MIYYNDRSNYYNFNTIYLNNMGIYALNPIIFPYIGRTICVWSLWDNWIDNWSSVFTWNRIAISFSWYQKMEAYFICVGIGIVFAVCILSIIVFESEKAVDYNKEATYKIFAECRICTIL